MKVKNVTGYRFDLAGGKKMYVGQVTEVEDTEQVREFIKRGMLEQVK